MTEIWKPVAGYDAYEVSNTGRVRSIPRVVRGPFGCTIARPGRELTPRKGHYFSVTLYRDGRREVKTVHHLVLEAFVGPRPEGMMACHGPGGAEDNSVENLRWDTQSENVRDQLRFGTHRSGASLDSCGRGHIRTAKNTYVKRGCRDCDAANRRNRKRLGEQVSQALTATAHANAEGV